MNLSDIVKTYLDDGYANASAISKMCQDVILLKIKNSTLTKNIAIKGGVVLMALSKDKRRATQDLDVDFIKYSLNDESISAFINKLSDSNVKVKITLPMKKLNHQDYEGKRVFIELSDKFGNKYSAKLDIGVLAFIKSLELVEV